MSVVSFALAVVFIILALALVNFYKANCENANVRYVVSSSFCIFLENLLACVRLLNQFC